MSGGKKRVVLIGASYRGMHGFIRNIRDYHSDTHEVAGILDLSIEKIADMNEYIGTDIRGYTDLDEMLEKTSPDIAVIAPIDCVHVDYLEKMLAAGIESVIEKPLCVDEEQCRRVRAAQARYPDVRAVTAHNLRYNPYSLKMKEILDSGEIGEIRSILFEELLDLDHGTSYYRRWNRSKKNSGGLIIHKSSHHFDLMNWFVGSSPKTLTASGALLAYGAANSPFGDDQIGPACHKCSKTSEECRFRSNLTGVRYKLHKNALESGGYTPDMCVFSPEIDAEDHIGVSYDYENGVHVSYNLCAHSAVESMRVGIEGTKARLEYHVVYDTIAAGKSEGAAPEHWHSLRVMNFGKGARDVPVEKVEGGHGGADTLLCRDLFGGVPSPAKASLEDGIQAVLVGVAANKSMVEGRAIDIQSLAPVE